jgi:hypothetical protein
LRFFRNHLRTDESEFGGNAHDHVGVVNRPAIFAYAAKRYRFVAKIRTEPLEHFRMGPLRQRRVGELVNMIENQAACPFQASPLFLAGRVIDYRRDVIILAQLIDHIRPPFAAARGRVHRIKHHAPVMVGRQPIVRENRVRLFRRGRVTHNVNPHTCLPQRPHRGVELTSSRS